MASGKGNTRANAVLDWLLGGSDPTRPTTGSIKIALTSTGTSASAVGTEITGTGYTSGGYDVDFTAASSQSVTGPVTGGSITLTNSSGGDWTIDGAMLHDNGTFPVSVNSVLYYINGLALVVGNGADLIIGANGITVQES